MAVASAADLLAALRQFRLLPVEQLNSLAGDIDGKAMDARTLAGKLIRDGHLTPYQVNQLLQGRGQELLLGSYVLLERLGEGGMGAVFKAKHQRLGRVAALKVIRKDRLQNEQSVRRFQREVRAAAQLSHPNIVVAYDADEVAGTHFMAMECIDGTDLARLVKEKGPLPVELACEYARQASLGLQHAFEQGLVHRDVKPHNLLLTRGGVVKVLDLGLARLKASAEGGESTSTLTQEGAVMGTPDYIAPEQARGAHEVDIRADLYGLGCTLYFLLTGRVPFPGGTLGAKLIQHQLDEPVPVEQLRPGVPPWVAAVVRKLMAKRPEDRFQTPVELAAALASGVPAAAPASAAPSPDALSATAAPAPAVAPAKDDIAAYVPPATDAGRLRPPSRGRSRLFWGVALGGVLAALAALLLVVLPRPSSRPEGVQPAKDPTLSPAPPLPPAKAEQEITNSLGMKLVLIPAGKFIMGSPNEEPGRNAADEGPRHEVEITRPFYMGACPVTQTEYEQATGKDPSWFSNEGGGRALVRGYSTKRFPVEMVSWDDAAAFCETLNRQDKERPAGWVYGLPTEAEWEYACRAGTTTAWPFGDSPDDMGQYACCAHYSTLSSHTVGLLKPNAWGLCDMLGNVWQWCADRYGPYPERACKDANGAESGDARVLRGGCYSAKPSICRSAHRFSHAPDWRVNIVGFRVVLRPPAEPGKEVANSIGMKLTRLPAGKFRMGSPREEAGRNPNEDPQHDVEIPRPFYLGAYPVTKGQFAAFVEAEHYRTQGEATGAGSYNERLRNFVFGGGNWRNTGFAQTDDHPVVDVTWDDAVAFCDWLSKKEGKPYRLPTEAEWEYACRAGTTSRYWCGDADDSLKGNANVADLSLKDLHLDPSKAVAWSDWDDGYPFTSPVGKYPANPWGLYDMHGNVWQWCADWCVPYADGAPKDPPGVGNGATRVARGGSWWSPSKNCRSACRAGFSPTVAEVFTGFRVCSSAAP